MIEADKEITGTNDEEVECEQLSNDQEAHISKRSTAPESDAHPAKRAKIVSEAGGFKLILSDRSNTGYKGVSFIPKSHRSKPFLMMKRIRSGEQISQYFTTAVDAAIAYAQLAQVPHASQNVRKEEKDETDREKEEEEVC